MRRWFVRLLGISLGLLLLTGCITQQTTTTIKADGSGTNEVLFGIDKSMMGMMGGSGEDPFAEAKDGVNDVPAEWNAKVEDWSDDKYQGVKITADFKSLEMLEQQLNQMLGPESQGSGDNPAAGMFTAFSVTKTGDDILITTSANPGKSMGSSDDPSAEQMKDAFKDAKITWTIKMPSIKSAGPEEIAAVSGGQVVYTFNLLEDKEHNIEVRGSTVGGGLGGGGILTYVLIGVAALLVLGGAAFFLMRKKPQPAVYQAPGGYGQQGYDPNQYPQQQGYDPNQYPQQGQQGQWGQQQGYDPNQYPQQGQQGQWGQQQGYDPNQPQGGQWQNPNDPNRPQ